jgi:hypothetical protein
MGWSCSTHEKDEKIVIGKPGRKRIFGGLRSG